MENGKNKLIKKVTATAAGVLAIIGSTSGNSIDSSNDTENVNSITEQLSNKVIKPQLTLRPNTENPGESSTYMHTSHRSHSSHKSHSSHRSHYSGSFV